MAAKRILTIGFGLASSETQYESFKSKTSFLDWDIVLFKPEVSLFLRRADQYQGRPSLDDSSSFRLKECCEHWRREIKQAVDAGKTVIVFLTTLEEILIDTGQRSYSGTGRNQRTTVHVTPYDNCRALPISLLPVTAKGNAIKLVGREAQVLASYWNEFEKVSQYKAILQEPKVPACLVTRTGDKPVGAIYRNRTSAVTLLLLTEIDFHPTEFLEGKSWTSAAQEFAGRMVSTIVGLDRALHIDAEVTPEPWWALNQGSLYRAERRYVYNYLRRKLQSKRRRDVRSSFRTN